MLELAEGLEEEMRLVALQPAVRERRIASLIRNLQRAKSAAIAEETEWARITAHVARMMPEGDEEKRSQIKSRAEIIHKSRCAHIKAAAQCARFIVRYVAGDLRIDASTAGTGLDTEERRMVSGVLGIGEDAW